MITLRVATQYFDDARHIMKNLAGRQASANFLSIAPGADVTQYPSLTLAGAHHSPTLTQQRSRMGPVDGSGTGVGSCHRAVLALLTGLGCCRCLASVYEVSRCQAIENKAIIMRLDTLDTLDTIGSRICARARACTSNHVSKVSYVSNSLQEIDFIGEKVKTLRRHGLDTSPWRKPIKYPAVAP
jgi:hypothetical protein